MTEETKALIERGKKMVEEKKAKEAFQHDHEAWGNWLSTPPITPPLLPTETPRDEGNFVIWGWNDSTGWFRTESCVKPDGALVIPLGDLQVCYVFDEN